MKPQLALLLLAAAGSPLYAQSIEFEILPGIYPLDMSTDGSVIVGNDFNFETVRWTAGTGVVNLGRGTQSLGIGAGSPDCSDDGSAVSATIINAAGTLGTQGRWTEATGWIDLMPSALPDGGIIDQSTGSAWGISGDGEHVTGLYWRPGNGGPGGDGLAHASFSGPTTGSVIDLGSSMADSRANHTNYDGSVVVGWDTAHSFGYWSPTVWENGTLTHLNTNEGWAMANYINAAGDIIGGDTYNETWQRSDATIWTRNGAGWTETLLGSLPGTAAPHGLATVNSMTPDGSIIVGFNKFSNTAAAAGWIWNADDGMVNIIDWITARGVVIPEHMLIVDLTCISADGRTMAGIGINLINDQPLGFRITPTCAPDLAEPFDVLNLQDVFAYLAAFNASDTSADLAAPFGTLNLQDVFAYLALFNAGCSK